MVGETLSHYRILERLGEGGMGEVYVAEDTKLHRKVALKLLPQEMASDPERLERFEREARTVAALNHPNIVTIHSVEESNGTHFLTMELVEGKLLEELIPPHGLALHRFFVLAIPIADSLSAAHDRGITHRDLKPANVMVSDAGRVKVLDFGLAKLLESEPSTVTELPTREITQEGRVLGTVPYMSPEQAQGKPVDHRSDIFSFGIILYQMVTGRRPFRGESSADLISSILRDTPESVTDLKVDLPRHLGRIIRRCLEKDPQRRYQSALDLRIELEDLKKEIDSGELAPERPLRPSRAPRRAWWIAAGVAAAAVVAVVALLLSRSGAPAPSEGAPPLRASFTQLTDLDGVESYPSLSPSGEFLAYDSDASGNLDIYLQRVGGRNPMNLTAVSAADDTHAAFSPDGKLIAFRSERQGGGIFLMGATGESVRRLTDFGQNPNWSPDGKEIVFATEGVNDPLARGTISQLWAVEVASADLRKITDGDAVHPDWSPHGHRVAYWGLQGVATGQRDLWTIGADGKNPVPVTEDAAVDWNPIWSEDGRFLYFASDRGGSMNLWRVPIDEASGRILGEPEPLTTPARWSGRLSLSADGRQLAYQAVDQRSNIERLGIDPASGTVTGSPVPVTRGSRLVVQQKLSPDGEWLVFRTYGEQEDLFLVRSDGSELRQLTDDLDKDRGPRWSPDGSRIAFYSTRGSGRYEIWTIRPDGSGLERLTETTGRSLWFPIWSPDGSRIVASSDAGCFIIDVTKPTPVTEREALPPPATGSSLIASSWSSNGTLLAGDDLISEDYSSAPGILVYSFETGQYKRLGDFPGPFLEPVWLEDNRNLILHVGDQLLLVDTASGEHRLIDTVSRDYLVGGTVSLSRDNRTLYLLHQTRNADIWMATLH